MAKGCSFDRQREVLEAATGLGGSFSRDAVWSRYVDRFGRVLDRRELSACLQALEARGEVFATDGAGTLARWGGIRRGSWWATRETLEREYGYGPAELGPRS